MYFKIILNKLQLKILTCYLDMDKNIIKSIIQQGWWFLIFRGVNMISNYKMIFHLNHTLILEKIVKHYRQIIMNIKKALITQSHIIFIKIQIEKWHIVNYET